MTRYHARHRRPRDRRIRALHGWQLALWTAIAIPVILGTVMIRLHGFAFFVFRAGGTGQSPDSFPSENQGPGQPDARVLLAAVAPDGTKITVSGQPGMDWASVAQRRDDHWTVIYGGSSQAQLRHATASYWHRYSGHFTGVWTVVPLRRA